MERTVEIAVRLRCTIYDASYLALAAIEECVLFTADDGLVALAPRETKVVHVREYRRQGLGEPSVDESRAECDETLRYRPAAALPGSALRGSARPVPAPARRD